MTTKKSKKYDLANKINLKHKPTEVKKKNQKINKGTDTFFSIPNEEKLKTLTSNSK